MHDTTVLHDLAILLATAGVTTVLCKKLKQPVVLGYLLAGLVLGPYTPPRPLIRDMANVRLWAELGVIFLMFSLGLEFTFHKLRRLGIAVFGTALFQCVLLLLLGLCVGRLLGFAPLDALFLGALICVSSTTVVLKAFQHLGVRNRRFAEIVLGVLIVEDLVAILLLVGLSTIAASRSDLGLELAQAGFRLLVVVGSWVLVGYFFVPTFFRRAGRFLDDETMTVLSIGLCLVLVVVALKFNYSPALAAFLMGSILAETDQAERIDKLVAPVRDLFGAVFFVSVGMLVDPQAIVANWGVILAVVVTVVLGNVFGASAGAFLFGTGLRDSVLVGTSLAQIGEFSFIIAGLGASLGVMKAPLYPIAVAVAAVTAFLTPYLLGVAEPLAERVERALPTRVRGWATQYEAWVRRVLSNSRGHWAANALLRWVACGIAMTLAFAFSRALLLPLLREWAFPAFQARVVAWGAALAACAPFLWGMFFAVRGGTEGDVRRGNTEVFVVVLRLIAAVWVGGLSRTFLPTGIALLATLMTVAAVFLLSYRRLERGYRWAEARLVGNLRSDEGSEETRLLESLAPWDLHLVRVPVHPNAAAAGRALQDLDLRGRFTANVVAIRRGELTLAPPGPGDRLFPGDDVLVLATDEGLKGVEHELGPTAAAAPQTVARKLSDYRLSHLVVEEKSALLGRTIRTSNIRSERQAIVVGMERSGERILNPNPDVPLEVGDVLWIVAMAG